MSAHHTTTHRGCVRPRVADWDTTRRRGSRGRAGATPMGLVDGGRLRRLLDSRLDACRQRPPSRLVAWTVDPVPPGVDCPQRRVSDPSGNLPPRAPRPVGFAHGLRRRRVRRRDPRPSTTRRARDARHLRAGDGVGRTTRRRAVGRHRLDRSDGRAPRPGLPIAPDPRPRRDPARRARLRPRHVRRRARRARDAQAARDRQRPSRRERARARQWPRCARASRCGGAIHSPTSPISTRFGLRSPAGARHTSPVTRTLPLPSWRSVVPTTP